MHKVQGNIGEAAAILHFTKLGYVVSKPLYENSPYDLIVDDSGNIYRIQVKTTKNVTPYGNFRVELRTKGGNSSWNGVVKTVNSESCDSLYIYCEDGTEYLIPVHLISGQVTVTLGDKYDEYKVNAPVAQLVGGNTLRT